MTPESYRALAIATALDFYARTGMKVNTAYTPTNMLRAAHQMTGQQFKRGQYSQAAAALRVVAQRKAMESAS